jgi:hypothetical protein
VLLQSVEWSGARSGQLDLLFKIGKYIEINGALNVISSGIPRRNHFTLIFIQIGDIVWWDLLKFRVVFAISGDFLAINLTNPNMRYGFSCSS